MYALVLSGEIKTTDESRMWNVLVFEVLILLRLHDASAYS